jgi:hypothetical protein
MEQDIRDSCPFPPRLNDPEESLRHLEIIEGKKRCPTMPPDLKGREKIDRIFPPIGELNKNFYGIVGNGGFWKPPECVAQQRLAIIIPYRFLKEVLKRGNTKIKWIFTQEPGRAFAGPPQPSDSILGTSTSGIPIFCHKSSISRRKTTR